MLQHRICYGIELSCSSGLSQHHTIVLVYCIYILNLCYMMESIFVFVEKKVPMNVVVSRCLVICKLIQGECFEVK